MFEMFKADPVAKLEKAYRKKQEEATSAQRSGDMPRFATLSSEAEAIGKELDRLRQSGSGGSS